MILAIFGSLGFSHDESPGAELIPAPKVWYSPSMFCSGVRHSPLLITVTRALPSLAVDIPSFSDIPSHHPKLFLLMISLRFFLSTTNINDQC